MYRSFLHDFSSSWSCSHITKKLLFHIENVIREIPYIKPFMRPFRFFLLEARRCLRIVYIVSFLIIVNISNPRCNYNIIQNITLIYTYEISNQGMKIWYIDIDINMTLEMKYYGVLRINPAETAKTIVVENLYGK